MNLPILIQNSQRVLTTAQLAESYGTDVKIISNNFTRNRDRYKDGKHYLLLKGEELKQFKAIHQNDEQLKFSTQIYLWTEKGAWLHAKSLNTDQAWDAYEMLVDEYYNIKDQVDTSNLSPELQMFSKIFNSLAKAELEQKKLASEVQGIRDVVALNSTDWRKDANAIINKVAQNRGGFQAYQDVRNEVYQEVERRGGFQLSTRLTNKRRRLAEEGVSKSRRDKLSKVDVIGDDKRLVEIYLAVVKEFAIANKIEV